MYLVATDQTIEAVSDATATTTEPTVVVDYVDITTTAFTPGASLTDLNGTTGVTIVSAPASSTTRQVKGINIFNADTVVHEIAVMHDDNGTSRTLIQTTMQPNETLVWTPELGWSNNLELLNLFGADNDFTGTNTFARSISGDPGNEASGVVVGGTTQQFSSMVSDIGGSNVAQLWLHRHSTTLAPILGSTRSHTDDATHAVVQDGDQLFRLIGAGWDGADYAIGAEMRMVVDGTPGAGDMPTRIDFSVSPDGSETPATAMSINPNGTVTFDDPILGADGSAAAPSYSFDSDPNTGIFRPTTDNLAFAVGGSEAARIDSSGNMSIGGTGASQKLQITDATDAYARFYNTTFGGTGFDIGQDSDGKALLIQRDNAELAVFTNGLQRYTTDGSGNTVWGNSDSTNYGTTKAGMWFRTAIHVLYLTRDSGACATFNRLTNTGALLQFKQDGTAVGDISVTGSATSYNTSSDYRLKFGDISIDNSVGRLMALRPIQFNWVAEPGKQVDGFFAHEVQEIVPEAVTGEKDAVDENGEPIYQGIDQAKLVPLLTAALQEAHKRIDEFEKRISNLEG